MNGKAPEHLWEGPDGERRLVNDHVAAVILGPAWKRVTTAPASKRKAKSDDGSGGSGVAPDIDRG